MILDQLQSAIADRYKVERELGRGGMATVFLATDVRHDRQVAIKVLHPDLAATIGAERFEREIKLAAKLQHPHILGLIDSGEADGLFYYVMPFIQGESVRDMLDREKQLSVDHAIQITLEVADALGYAHAQNIIHRDIKPENVMMSNGHALVADFGIARARTEAGQNKLTQTGMAVGTPVYMSPEQATGESVGPSADIYSLGCMLYEMLAGEPPFNGPNAMAIMARHAMEAVPSIRIIRPAVPEEVEEAILHAMEKNVADRPKTAAEFCEILGTPLGATATRRVTGRHTARHRVPTGARMPAYSTEEQAVPAPLPLWKRPLVVASGLVGVVAVVAATWMALSGPSANAAVGNSDVTVTPKRIAVLYLDDNTNGKLGYLADGLTETLIEELKRVRELDVLSRDAVSRFRGSNASIDSVISALAPGTIVRGSVTEDGDLARISVRVFDGNGVDRGAGMAFSLPYDDLLAVRQAFSDSVSTYLRQVVGDVVTTRRLESGTENRGAFSLLQQAERRRKDAVAAMARDSAGAARNFTLADSLLHEAELLDPGWATPVALRATLALNQSRSARHAALKKPIIERGFGHANRALNIEANNVDALEARGRLYHERWALQLEEDKPRAQELLRSALADYEKVVAADPTRAGAWISKSQVHAQLFDQLGAYESANRAYEEDAYSSFVEIVLRQMFATAHDLRQFAKAQEHCDLAARRFPRNWNFVSCKLVMRATGTVTSGPDSAWNELKTLAELAPANEREFQIRRHQMFVAATLARHNLKDSARAVIERARADQTIDPFGRLLTAEALIRTLLGTSPDTLIAFEKLREYVISQPLHGAGFANTEHWWWSGLRRDSRWSDYLERNVQRR